MGGRVRKTGGAETDEEQDMKTIRRNTLWTTTPNSMKLYVPVSRLTVKLSVSSMNFDLFLDDLVLKRAGKTTPLA